MKPVIVKSGLLNKFENLVSGISTNICFSKRKNSLFNLGAESQGSEAHIKKNREAFFKSLDINPERVVFESQIHSANITYVDSPGRIENNDALVTDQKNLFLTVNIADCIPIMIFDPVNSVVASIHAGWRGTLALITKKCMDYLICKMKCKTKNMFVYLGPSICKECFEVDWDVASQFPSNYIKQKNSKYIVDLKAMNYDLLRTFQVPKEQIQISRLCTYELSQMFHSYRRYKDNSGRMLAIIGMR
ncbi:MAG: peptidoglycan editing factor PgeF [Ignavibacteria bacterium]|nr:peptidoglycan editing factor PgeF [Ignavibacteria bacterium]